MGLDRQKLYDGLLDAFVKGKETQEVSGGEEGETESKYSDADVAGFIADAIAAYAADAIEGLFTQLGLPTKLNEVGVHQDGISQIADDAMTDFGLHRNVRKIQNVDELINILVSVR